MKISAQPNKIASSASLEGLVKLLKEYFYSDSIRIDGDKVLNSKGEIAGFKVEFKKGKHTCIQETL